MGYVVLVVDLPTTSMRTWQLVRDFHHPERLAPGFVEACNGSDDVRRVRLVGGAELTERLISCDDESMRLAYSAISGQSEYHHASMQAVTTGSTSCRLVWATDVLPDALDEYVRTNMRRGLCAIESGLTTGGI